MTSPAQGASFPSQSGRTRHFGLFIQSVNRDGEPIYMLDSHVPVSLFHNLKKLSTPSVRRVSQSAACLFHVDLWVRVLGAHCRSPACLCAFQWILGGREPTRTLSCGRRSRLAAIQTGSRIDGRMQGLPVGGFTLITPWLIHISCL